MFIFEVFLLVREPFVATFSETRAVTSPKDIVCKRYENKVWKQGMKISNRYENKVQKQGTRTRYENFKSMRKTNYFGNLVQFLL